MGRRARRAYIPTGRPRGRPRRGQEQRVGGLPIEATGPPTSKLSAIPAVLEPSGVANGRPRRAGDACRARYPHVVPPNSPPLIASQRGPEKPAPVLGFPAWSRQWSHDDPWRNGGVEPAVFP